MNALARILRELKPQDDDALDQLRGSGTILFYKIISEGPPRRHCDDDNFIILDGDISPERIVEATQLHYAQFLDGKNFVELSLKYCEVRHTGRAFYQRIWSSDGGFIQPPDCVRLAPHLNGVPSLSLRINVVPAVISESVDPSEAVKQGPQATSICQEPIDEIERKLSANISDLSDIRKWAYEDETLRDIRTLLITLNRVCGETNTWTGLSLKDVRDPPSVKKLYRIAILAFHPDRTGEDAAKSEIFHCLHRSYLAYTKNNR